MRKFQLLLAAVAALAFAIPAAAAAPPPLEVYGDLPGFDQPTLSPSGARIALIGKLEGARRLIVLENGKLVGGANIGDQKVRAVHWAGEDKVVLITSATYNIGPGFLLSKYEILQGVALDLKTSKLTPILQGGPAGHGIWGSYGLVEQEGRWYGYFGGITLARGIDSQYRWEDGHPDLYRVDLETGRETRAAPGADGDGLSRTWLLGADGTILATFDFNDKHGDWALRNAQSRALVASGTDPLGGVGLISQGRTPGTVVYYVTDSDGSEHWMEAPLGGGRPAEILADENIYDALTDPASGLLIGFLRSGDAQEPVFFDALRQGRTRSARKAFPGVNSQLVSWNDAFDKLILFTDGPQDSGTWWLVDLTNKKADPIGYSYPAVVSTSVGPMKMVSYKAADGLEMEGVLTLPPGREARNLPLVVLPHGGPEARDFAEFDWWAQAFASRGYAVFQPNFRGSSGYSESFTAAGRGEWGRKMQTDISDGVAELGRQGIVDPRRACIVGASYGGYAALAGVTIEQGLYRCAVSVAGVTDLPDLHDYRRNLTGRSQVFARDFKRDIGEGPALKEISPARLAARADAPVLLIHGKDDTVVPLAQSRAMERALKGAGKPVELVILEGEDHWLSSPDTRQKMLQSAVAFVEKHNPAN